MHRERGVLENATFKISPYKLGGRPLQGFLGDKIGKS